MKDFTEVEKLRKYRDISLIDIGGNRLIAVACDSTGGIGEKENDSASAPAETVGFYSAQVVLMELISIDAEIISVVNNLCVEMIGYGEKLIEGVRKASESAGLDGERIINGSTEENFPVTVTAIGVTAIGIMNKEMFLKRKEPEKGNLIVRLGSPRVGRDILESSPNEIMTADKMIKIKKEIEFIELIPVGSKGSLYEISSFADSKRLDYKIYDSISEKSFKELEKSGGPSTSAVGIVEREEIEKIERINFKYEIIGELI